MATESLSGFVRWSVLETKNRRKKRKLNSVFAQSIGFLPTHFLFQTFYNLGKCLQVHIAIRKLENSCSVAIVAQRAVRSCFRLRQFFFLQCRIAQDSCGHVPANSRSKRSRQLLPCSTKQNKTSPNQSKNKTTHRPGERLQQA